MNQQVWTNELVDDFEFSGIGAATVSVEFSESAETSDLESVLNFDRSLIGEWTDSLENEFLVLTAKKATKEITPSEFSRWSFLKKSRRELLTNPPAEEVIFQLKRRRLEADMIAKLREYVEFLKTAGSSCP